MSTSADDQPLYISSSGLTSNTRRWSSPRDLCPEEIAVHYVIPVVATRMPRLGRATPTHTTPIAMVKVLRGGADPCPAPAAVARVLTTAAPESARGWPPVDSTLASRRIPQCDPTPPSERPRCDAYS